MPVASGDLLQKAVFRMSHAPTNPSGNPVIHWRDRNMYAKWVYIGGENRLYNLPASVWANPFELDKDGTRDEVLEKYASWLNDHPELIEALHEFRGYALVCWCAPEPCHGTILAAFILQRFPAE